MTLAILLTTVLNDAPLWVFVVLLVGWIGNWLYFFKERNQKIFVNKEAKIIHLEAKSTDIKFEFEKCRNWHWMWSKIYFNKKYSNKIIVTLKFLPKLLLIFLKLIFYLLMINKNKTIIYYYRMSGMFNSLIGKTSWFRPRFKDI